MPVDTQLGARDAGGGEPPQRIGDQRRLGDGHQRPRQAGERGISALVAASQHDADECHATVRDDTSCPSDLEGRAVLARQEDRRRHELQKCLRSRSYSDLRLRVCAVDSKRDSLRPKSGAPEVRVRSVLFQKELRQWLEGSRNCWSSCEQTLVTGSGTSRFLLPASGNYPKTSKLDYKSASHRIKQNFFPFQVDCDPVHALQIILLSHKRPSDPQHQ